MSNDDSKKNNAVQIDNPDLSEAINACLKHASEHYGLSVKDIAPGMNINKTTAEAVGGVAGFMSGDKSKRDAIKAIDTAIESLVWQKSRIKDA